MPFLFDESHDEFAESVRRLAAKEFAAGYLSRAKGTAFPSAEYQALADGGLLGLRVPASLGGQDADHVSVGIACEELARADFNIAYLVFSAAVTGGLVAGGLRAEARERWGRAVADGSRLGAAAITEPRGGSDATGLRLRAEPVQGGWVLSGEKTSVTLGPHADFAVVFATVDPALGTSGIHAFVVPLDDPTVSRQAFDDPGFRPLGRGSLSFDGTFVGEEHLLGEPGRGIQMILGEFDFTRALLGLMVVGCANAAITMTVEYAKERTAFGQPISRYQGVSFPLAEHHTHLEAARWLCYRALALRDAGRPHTKEAAMCKWWAPKVAFDAINDCIVAHGHVGWSDEMPLSQMLRDVSGLQIGDGTPQIQKLVIARHLFGREFSG